MKSNECQKPQPNNIKLIDAKINCRTHIIVWNTLNPTLIFENISINGILLSTLKIKRAHDTLCAGFFCYFF